MLTGVKSKVILTARRMKQKRRIKTWALLLSAVMWLPNLSQLPGLTEQRGAAVGPEFLDLQQRPRHSPVLGGELCLLQEWVTCLQSS